MSTGPSIIDEAEGHHPNRAHGAHPVCVTDGSDWPCLTQRLVTEIQRLRAERAEIIGVLDIAPTADKLWMIRAILDGPLPEAVSE